jgi:hypothetical protein
MTGRRRIFVQIRHIKTMTAATRRDKLIVEWHLNVARLGWYNAPAFRRQV